MQANKYIIKKQNTLVSRDWGQITQTCSTCCLVTRSCPTDCDSMDCSLLAFSVHGISQARILKCVLTSFSHVLFQRYQNSIFLKGKQVFNRQYIFLYKQFKQSEPLLTIGLWEFSQNPSFQTLAKGNL